MSVRGHSPECWCRKCILEVLAALWLLDFACILAAGSLGGLMYILGF